MHPYKQALREAEEAVKDIADVELRKVGFEVILKQLLHTEEAVPQRAQTTKVPTRQAPAISTYTNTTGLNSDELDTLFEKKEDTVALKVRPTGATIKEQQQLLAHAVLIGHKSLLGQDAVGAMKLAAVAKEWNLLDKNFGETIQTPGLIQAKGKKRGVIYSFRPGAIAKLKEQMQKMARGD
ncbi:MAG: hypothetical protein WA021_02225 [Minisyncoccia bacterium]